MPLITGANFGINFPSGGGVADTSGLTNAFTQNLMGAIQEKEREKKLQQAQQLQEKQKFLQGTAINLLDIGRNGSDFVETRRQVIKEIQKAKDNGADLSKFSSILEATNLDELNTSILNMSTRMETAANTAKRLSDKINPSSEKGFTLGPNQKRYSSTGEEIATNESSGGSGGLASAVTKVLDTGATIQALPSGDVIVKNPLGELVEGQERLTILKEAQDQKIFRQEKEAEIAVKKARDIARTNARQGRISDIKKDYSDRGRLAARSEIRLRRGLKLAKRAVQGLSGDVKVQFAKLFPNIDVTDEASLSQSLRSLALDELQKFKGPTTDFEFGIAESTVGALGDPATANIARLKGIMRNNWFNTREVEQFESHVKNGGDPDGFRFNFGEPMKTKKGVFTLRELQDTAVDNNLTIEEVIERLNQ